MLEAVALSDKGCVRSNNEDFCRVDSNLGLYVLADGMGGARAGERASRLAVETVFDAVGTTATRNSQVLLGAVEEANRRVLDEAGNDPKLEGMGTTLVAAMEMKGEIAIASVGDSRAYILDEGGFRAITQDQTWVNDVGKPLGLDEATLRRHPMRHVLTQAIGASLSLTINYYVVKPRPEALVLISSDGLHGVVEEAAIEEMLRGGLGARPLEPVGRALIEAAREAGGPDNISVVLMRIP